MGLQLVNLWQIEGEGQIILVHGSKFVKKPWVHKDTKKS